MDALYLKLPLYFKTIQILKEIMGRGKIEEGKVIYCEEFLK